MTRRLLPSVLVVVALAGCATTPGPGSSGATSSGPDRMVAFGYKTAWYAVRDRTRAEVVDALGFRSKVRTTSWSEGVEKSYDLDEPGIAITPPFDAHGARWVLVTSRVLMTEHPDVASVSTKLGGAEVLYFVSDRVTETHGWARADAGVLRRLYVHSGEQGAALAQRGARESVDLAGGDDLDESDVMALAGRLSVNPQHLPSLPYAGPLVVAD